MELQGNGAQLSAVETMLGWAKQMPWQGRHRVVELRRKVYDKGISRGKAGRQAGAARWQRDPALSTYDMLIDPASLA